MMPKNILTISYIDKLQRENADDLAFYPLGTLEKALETKHIIGCFENDEPAGYLWYGAISGGKDIIIYQACVDYDARRRTLGHNMVADLLAIGKAAGATGIRLKCASSALSNEFWQAIGFYCSRVSKGGIKRGRDINWYRTDIQQGFFLFDNIIPSEKPIDLTEYNKLKRANAKMPSRFARNHY